MLKTTALKRLLAPALLLALLLISSHAVAFDWLSAGKKLLGGGTTEQSGETSALTLGDISSGLKEALKVGSERVTAQLGTVDGFNADTAIHIPLPDSLQKVKTALKAVGMSGMMDDLELKLNRAAEVATPQAKELFWNAIQEMTLDDVQMIYNGPDDAATRYFQDHMSAELGERMKPIVEQSIAEVGAVTLYDNAIANYKNLPFVPDVKADLSTYVVNKGIDGIFYYLAKEEAAIRANPAARTTELLKKVFGAQN
ncbi:MAG: DUF4197 domain-containing protein [Desulfuromonas sp.]|nr:MAG: DUF4197 domain-containing protein [Desulfuromonas sp.]